MLNIKKTLTKILEHLTVPTVEQYGSAFVRSYGRIRQLNIGSAAGASVGTLPAKHLPIDKVDAFGTVYNGSSYVDCIISVNATTGAVTISDAWGGAISGMSAGYLHPAQIVYIAKE